MFVTPSTPKSELIESAHKEIHSIDISNHWTLCQKVALTCRILYENGHDSRLAGQVSARDSFSSNFYTQQLGFGFEETCARNLVRVDPDLQIVEGSGMPNPANRFHSWIYMKRPDVHCIIHTHAPHTSALSMLGVPLIISHMDYCPLYENCGFLSEWPGIPIGNEEGDIISASLGEKSALLLSHHGCLVAAQSVEKACVLAILFERAARIQLLAMAAGKIQAIHPERAREAMRWTSTPRRFELSFAYESRRALRKHVDCIQ